jgi:FlaA1/EpsC-like NDP-sugar epimerase
MILDGITILAAAALATLYAFQMGPVECAQGFWRGTLIHGRSLGLLLALLCEFIFALIMISRRLHLYTPTRLTSLLHEQRLSVQACFISGLLLTCTLYLVDAQDIPRSIVLVTVGLVTISLSLRRLVYRFLIYRRLDRGLGTRNVLIVGTGPEAHALRHHLESIRHLGYTFKGFIDFSGSGSGSRSRATSGDVVGTLDTLFQNVRKQFVDEIFFTTSSERGIVQDVLDQARRHGVDLRVVPDMYDGLTWSSPIEYIGQFPTIPLHWGRCNRRQAGFARPGFLLLGAHRQEGPCLQMHQVSNHGLRRRAAPRRRHAHERARGRALQDIQRSPRHPAGPLPAQIFAG